MLGGCGAAVRPDPNPYPNPNPNPNPNPGPTEVATSAPCRARLVGADGARGTNEACVAELSDSSLLTLTLTLILTLTLTLTLN